MVLNKFLDVWHALLFTLMLTFCGVMPFYWVYDHHIETVRVPCQIVEASPDVPQKYKDECEVNRKGHRL
jgi:hypothetical protein